MGALIQSFGGFDMPIQYSSIIEKTQSIVRIIILLSEV